MIVELRKIRFALADIENQLEFSLNNAQEKIQQLQNNYQTALQEIDKLNNKIKELTENGRQNSDTKESPSGVSEVSTRDNVKDN